MKKKKYINALFRAEDYQHIEEFIIRLKSKNINRDSLLIYSGTDNIFSIELVNKLDKNLKYKIIKESKNYIRKKIKEYDYKMSFYTYLSLLVPDKALVNYKLENSKGLTMVTGDKFDDNKYFSYIDDTIVVICETKEDAIKQAIKHACENAFIYMTRIDYAKRED